MSPGFLLLLRVSWRSKSAWQSAVFAAFAERYQIWAAGAHPLVEAAARRGGVRGDAGKRRREERKAVGSEDKLLQMYKSTVCNGAGQSLSIFKCNINIPESSISFYDNCN